MPTNDFELTVSDLYNNVLCFRKLRDPLNNPSFMFKKGMERMTRDIRKPKLNIKLRHHVHTQLRVRDALILRERSH